MSATYTRWIYHGEPADSTEVENTKHRDVEGDHDYGIHVDVDNDDHLDEDLGVPEMIGDLYAQAEPNGEQPRFARVLEDAKKALSPGSRIQNSHLWLRCCISSLVIESAMQHFPQ
jgi:hypothetical protein